MSNQTCGGRGILKLKPAGRWKYCDGCVDCKPKCETCFNGCGWVHCPDCQPAEPSELYFPDHKARCLMNRKGPGYVCTCGYTCGFDSVPEEGKPFIPAEPDKSPGVDVNELIDDLDNLLNAYGVTLPEAVDIMKRIRQLAAERDLWKKASDGFSTAMIKAEQRAGGR